MTAIQGGAALPILQSNQPAPAGAAIPMRDIRQGILVSGSGSVSANVNRVVNNEIIEGGSVNLANGILETSPADNNDYFQNTIVGATTGITVAGAGSVNSNNRVV